MKRSGSALLLLSTLSILLVLTAVMVYVNAFSNANTSTQEKIRTKLEFACESGLKRARSKIETSFNNNTLTTLQPNVLFQGTTADDTGQTPAQKVYADETYNNATPCSYSFTIKSNVNNLPITIKYAITQSQTWHLSQNYTTYTMNIQSIASIPGHGQLTMSEQAYARRTTLFMYNIFFQNTLEILPGPNFNLQGLIHTNQDLYLNSDNTLAINTNGLTAAGQIHRGRLDSTSSTGTVQISSVNQSGSLVTMNNGIDATNSQWTSLASKNWQGTVKDKSLGATVQSAPTLQSFTPGGYYDKTANLNIQVITKGYTHPRYKITYNGTTTTYDSSNANNGLNGALTETKFYDNREYTTKQVSATNIDIKLLSNLYTPTNGLIYMTRDDAVADANAVNGNYTTPSTSKIVSGFELTNGKQLNNPSTFVSNLPTYIKGDFNLHTNASPSLDTWQPCAVIADAVDLLSNAWSDTNSKTTQAATTTTYNVVLITGNIPTSTGNYNGGLENFPRFLENWNGQTVNMSGSFIQLFRSIYATGHWGSSYYSAPTRSWKAESDFSDLRNFPPGFINLFPSTNVTIVYSQHKQISNNEATLH